jgi:hypothetical protein
MKDWIIMAIIVFGKLEDLIGLYFKRFKIEREFICQPCFHSLYIYNGK